MQYVIVTISNNEGIVTKYATIVDRVNRFKDTESFIQGLEGISVTTYDNIEDYFDAITEYDFSNNCEYCELML